jgi:hypothetical protein
MTPICTPLILEFGLACAAKKRRGSARTAEATGILPNANFPKSRLEYFIRDAPLVQPRLANQNRRVVNSQLGAHTQKTFH